MQDGINFLPKNWSKKLNVALEHINLLLHLEWWPPFCFTGCLADNQKFQNNNFPFVPASLVGAYYGFEWKNFDACHTTEKLVTIQAIYIIKLKSVLNTRDEHRVRDLTLK